MWLTFFDTNLDKNINLKIQCFTVKKLFLPRNLNIWNKHIVLCTFFLQKSEPGNISDKDMDSNIAMDANALEEISRADTVLLKDTSFVDDIDENADPLKDTTEKKVSNYEPFIPIY